ncbi:WD40 repeat-like protein [Rhizoctonia solani]|uniref:WD40 repeat-like protein n=1 Tax=Rhizoctonia solani TaxID=456999 RepID=A0A8H7I6Q3_9AGAM|nr:WD40 repeat-like protein [Rhizoctonia solani]
MSGTQPQRGIMPFLMNLSDSLKYSKDKFKRRLGMRSKDDSRPSSAIGSHPCPTPLSEPAQLIPPAATSTEDGSQVVASDPSVSADSTIEKPSGAWNAIRALLTTLESSTDAFGPLKSAISGLKGLIDIYENACKQRKEYNELGIRLKEILQDLADHIERPAGLMMTKSVNGSKSDEIMEEAKRVANKQANKTGRRLIDAMEESDGIMECYRRIDGHLRRITLNASMGALEAIKEHTLVQCRPHVRNVQLCESLDVQRGICTSGTRKAQLKELMEWANMPDTGKTCWMNGMAGTGKTTIAYTVCSKLDKSNDWAPILAPFQRALAEVLEEDCDAHTRALNLQYQKLIIDPLKAVEKSLRKILWRSNGQDEARLVLHNLDSNMVKTDIETYMREELKGIPLKDSEWTIMIERCGVLFIYAATSAVIIDSGSASMEKGDERIIDELYKTILDNAFKGTELKRQIGEQ